MITRFQTAHIQYVSYQFVIFAIRLATSSAASGGPDFAPETHRKSTGTPSFIANCYYCDAVRSSKKSAAKEERCCLLGRLWALSAGGVGVTGRDPSRTFIRKLPPKPFRLS